MTATGPDGVRRNGDLMWKIDLRATLILTFLCILGSLSIMPAVLAARARVDAAAVPWWELYGSAVLNSVILFGLAAFFGLRAARAAGLKGAPLFTQWAGGEKAPPLIAAFVLSAGLGIVAGAAVFLCDLYIFHSGASAATSTASEAAATTSFFENLLGGVLYGGINEEVLMRLFVLSALVYLGGFVAGRTPRGRAILFGIAIVLAAVGFGLAHLPITATMTEITPFIVLRAVVLNGIVGGLAGILYVRYGLEAAAVSHAAAHIPIQTGVLVLAL